jgi:hypothetical protein
MQGANVRGTYIYHCSICTSSQTFQAEPLEAPVCRGPENTHSKTMQFDKEASSGTPAYLNKKGKKS